MFSLKDLSVPDLLIILLTQSTGRPPGMTAGPSPPPPWWPGSRAGPRSPPRTRAGRTWAPRLDSSENERISSSSPSLPPPTSWELFGLLQVSSVITTRAARGGTSQQMIIRRNNVNNVTVFFSFVRCSLRRPGKFRTSWAKQTHPYYYKSQYQCEDL